MEQDSMLELKVRLAEGHQRHLDTLDHNEPVKQALVTAARHGQTPDTFLFHNGFVDPRRLFGLHSPNAFTAGISPMFVRSVKEVGSDPSLYPLLAAASYVKEHVGARRFVGVYTEDGSMMPYVLGQKPMGPLMKPWAKVWSPVVQEALALADSGKAGVIKSVAEMYHLTALALLKRNADRIEAVTGRHVTCCYISGYDDRMDVLPHGSLEDMWHSKGDHRRSIEGLDLYAGKPWAVTHTCCDARAGHDDLHDAHPGEFISSNTIASLIPPQEFVLSNGVPHPSWAMAEHALRSGVHRAVITGHSKCGGIRGLVETRVNGADLGVYLNAWLGQAAPVIDEVVSYASKKGFLRNAQGKINDEVYTLAEMCAAQWSGRNLAAYFGEKNVLTYYLDIETREVYVLNPRNDVEQTHKSMHSLTTLRDSVGSMLRTRGAVSVRTGLAAHGEDSHAWHLVKSLAPQV